MSNFTNVINMIKNNHLDTIDNNYKFIFNDVAIIIFNTFFWAKLPKKWK